MAKISDLPQLTLADLDASETIVLVKDGQTSTATALAVATAALDRVPIGSLSSPGFSVGEPDPVAGTDLDAFSYASPTPMQARTPSRRRSGTPVSPCTAALPAASCD